MFYKNKLNSKTSESARATFTNQQSRARHHSPGRIIYSPQEFWTLFFLVIYCMDFKAFLHNHLYYLIWKGSLLLSSRVTACATGGLKHVDMLSLPLWRLPRHYGHYASPLLTYSWTCAVQSQYFFVEYLEWPLQKNLQVSQKLFSII